MGLEVVAPRPCEVIWGGCGGGSTFYELYFSKDYPVCLEQMSKTEPQKGSKRLRAGKCGPVWSFVRRQVAGRGTLSKHNKSTTKAAPPTRSRGLCRHTSEGSGSAGGLLGMWEKFCTVWPRSLASDGGKKKRRNKTKKLSSLHISMAANSADQRRRRGVKLKRFHSLRSGA